MRRRFRVKFTGFKFFYGSQAAISSLEAGLVDDRYPASLGPAANLNGSCGGTAAVSTAADDPAAADS